MTAPNTPAETSDQLNKPAKSGKLEVSDLITIGVFAALYFVMVCIATLVSTLFTGGFGSIFLPAITALISGCVYMLLAARLGKFGGITVMGVIIGLFLFISGHFVLSFIASIVFPVAADLIARAGKYKSKALLLVSYVVFSYGLTGPILPLWFMKDAYVGEPAGARQGRSLHRRRIRQHQHRHVLHLDDRDSGVRGSRRLVRPAHDEEALHQGRYRLMNPARRTLDPRAKLYLLLVANLMLFFHVGLATQIVMVVLFLLPLLAAARWRTALNFGVTYAVLTALGMLDPDALGLPWLHVVSALAVGVTMMLPCFITGAYTFTTTSASAFICAMRRMRVPEAVVIPCVVVIRFFPTIAEDYRQIRNAMALRGIASGGWGLVRHPAQSLEYILIPLLMNATNVAQDLSVAALTKGLGREGEHTSRTLIRMTVVDWLVMIVVTLPLALDIAGVI